MPYADITFRDRNPVKRWLQGRRLLSAIDLYGARRPGVLCDFGAGNGELCRLLAESHPGTRLICYEPVGELLREAKENLAAVPNVELRQDITELPTEGVDAIFCLEVFEHLPEAETAAALVDIVRLLKPNGIAIIGVPVEVGIPAIYRGAFRMARRYGSFDATFKNVAMSTIGRPPCDRPIREVGPGMRFHPFHTGFDFRRFRDTLRGYLRVREEAGSPIARIGPWLMPEVNFLAEKIQPLDRK